MSAFGEGPDDTIELLNIVPMQGPGGIVATSCDAAISLAVDDINTGAGFLGREIRTTNIDGGRDPRAVADEVSDARHRGGARDHRLAHLGRATGRDARQCEPGALPLRDRT